MYRFGPFELDTQRRVLLRNGRRVHLTAKVYTLLHILVERHGKVVSKNELIDLLWPDTVGTEANLTVNMAALRKALGEKRGEHRYVVTIPTRGYSFVAEVEGTDERSRPGATSPLKIAVLPPVLSDARDAEAHLPIGIADGISSRLARRRELELRPASAGSHAELSTLPWEEAARRLKVDLLVRGRLVRRRDSALDLQLEMFDSSRGEKVWSESFRNIVHGLPFAIAAAAGKMCTYLQLDEAGEKRMPHPRDPIAYNHYLEGRFHLCRFHPTSLERARSSFLRSLEREREAPCTWASLGLVYQYQVYFGQIPPREGFVKSEEAAHRALEYDPRSSLSYVLLGNIHRHVYWDWDAARRDHDLSLEFGPNDSLVHEHMGYHLLSEGRFKAAIAELHRALELDPTSLTLLGSLSWGYRLQRRVERARSFVETALRMDPGFLLAHYHAACNDFLEGNYAEALDALLTHEDDAIVDPYLQALIGHAYGGLGDTAGVERALARIARDDKMASTRALHSAIALAGLGDADRCVDELEVAARERHGFMGYLPYEPLWDKVRDNPRFIELSERIHPQPHHAHQ